MTREFTKVGVIGLGTMGAGIAEVIARSGLSVIGVETTDEALERGRGHVEHSTARAVKRGKLSEAEQQEIFDAITFTTNLADVKDAEIVIEAIPEHLDLKQQVFVELDRICPPETILATNTSSLSVTEISVATSRPSRVIGLHFFNPAPVMKLVEVIATVVTDPAVVADIEAFAQRLGKSDVTIGDKAGFIANALLFGYLNHAVEMFESRFARREDIDAAMRLGCGLPMGPLALMDLIGVDTAYEILDTMYRQSRNRLHAPAPLIKQLVTAGLLGRKTGRGFYTYEQPDSPVVVADDLTPEGPLVAGTPRPVTRVGVVGSGTMATGLVEVLAKGGYDVTFVTRGAEKVAAVNAAVARSLDKAVLRGKLTAEDRSGRRSPDHRLDSPGRSGRCRPGGGGHRRGVDGQASALRHARRCVQARCGVGDHDLVAADHRVRRRQRPAARRYRDAFLQPGAGDEARRGRPDRLHRR